MNLQELSNLVRGTNSKNGWPDIEPWGTRTKRHTNLPDEITEIFVSLSKALQSYRKSDRQKCTENIYRAEIRLDKLKRRITLDNSIWENNVGHTIPVLMLLVATEVSEAIGAYYDNSKEEFAKELADIAIRLLDVSGYLDIDLEKEIVEKNEFNATRGYRHGNKRI
jgi:NTP pyrophosphatase (non-canonical NTP hydrolase)